LHLVLVTPESIGKCLRPDLIAGQMYSLSRQMEPCSMPMHMMRSSYKPSAQKMSHFRVHHSRAMMGSRYMLLLYLLIGTCLHPAYAHSIQLDLPLNDSSTSSVISSEVLVAPSNPAHPFSSNVLLAQAEADSQSSNDSWSEEDTNNLLVGLVVLMILPLLWGPTRKAVGLLNIIVGTILTFTGIGAFIGIPMILIGGICLFI